MTRKFAISKTLIIPFLAVVMTLGSVMFGGAAVTSAALPQTEKVTATPSAMPITIRFGNIKYGVRDLKYEEGYGKKPEDYAGSYENIQTQTYLIDGSNYTKLADLAALIDFNVGYDSATDTVTINKHKHYVGVDPIFELSELKSGKEPVWAKNAPNVEAISSTQKFKIVTDKDTNDTIETVNIGAYLINGSNYVKIADVMTCLNMYFSYSEEEKKIAIMTIFDLNRNKIYQNSSERFND